MLQVKKSWKLSHIEVSAKYNWNITRSFRELSSQLVSVQSRLNSLGDLGAEEVHLGRFEPIERRIGPSCIH